MAIASKNQKEVPQNLQKQLAVGVKAIQWSYAIFWSPSARQPGVLEWGDGYYNGDIKTRKTVQASETDAADPLGLQRSDQLRELYDSLALGETNNLQAKRPTAALSPEDLTDAEWYFLVCMSFVFNVEQGLPGRTFVKNQPFWLCNAHHANTKLFSRSLLAKSASIQTIVCFPHWGGVVELGTTELVPEDLNLIHHIKESFLETSSGTVSKIINGSISNNAGDGLNQLQDCPNIDIGSPDDNSNDFADNLLRDESNLPVEGVVDGEVSQMQWQSFMDDAISNCLNNSMTSSDCVSQTYVNPETPVPVMDGENEPDGCIRDQGQDNENHYHSVLSNLLKSSHQLILGPYFTNGSRQSSFVSWRNDGLLTSRISQIGCQQRLLKKVLFEVARMHERPRVETSKQKGNAKQDTEDNDKNHVISERKRREKINERFAILGSLVPSGGKVDKVSILDHTIEYLRKLERKVEELESHKEIIELESTSQTKPQDAMERTSDNYGPNKCDSTKKPSTNKRKAYETDKTGPENKKLWLHDSSADNVAVSVTDKDVLIEIRCSWKDCAMINVMEAVSKLRMDTQTVQSSNADGILTMTVKAKSKGLKTASPNVIRQAIQKVIKKW